MWSKTRLPIWEQSDLSLQCSLETFKKSANNKQAAFGCDR